MIEILLALIAGIWIGKTVTNAWNQWTFMEILKDLKISEQDLRRLREQQFPEDSPAAADPVVEIKIEQHQGQLYAFRKDTDEFLGQGTDRDSLIARIAERYKGVKFVVQQDQGGNLIQNS